MSGTVTTFIAGLFLLWGLSENIGLDVAVSCRRLRHSVLPSTATHGLRCLGWDAGNADNRLYSTESFMPMKFRKKPVVIEAMHYHGGNAFDIISWAHTGRPPEANSIIIMSFNQALEIRTLEGQMIASVGDWIIRGVKGEFYPCRSDIFEATFEKVEQCQLKY